MVSSFCFLGQAERRDNIFKCGGGARRMYGRFNDAFYVSDAWKKCRDGYARSKGGLCERCMERGIIRAGEIVHHKVHLTADNITDPNITLNWRNLMLLCRECHGEIHSKPKRYKVLDDGRVIPYPPSEK